MSEPTASSPPAPPVPRRFPRRFRRRHGRRRSATSGATSSRREAPWPRFASGGTRIRGILTTAPREHLDLLRSDVRYALRNLRRSPAFAVTAVLALAVGIGANTAVFSIVNGVLLRRAALRASAAARVDLREGSGRAGGQVRLLRARLRDRARGRAVVRGHARRSATRPSSCPASPSPSGSMRHAVSPEIFSVLGVSPMLGRALTPDDDRETAKVAVLSHGLWTRAFGRDPSIVGRTITLDRQPYTVVGVMPERFEFPPRGSANNGEPAALFVPIAFSPFERQRVRQHVQQQVVARLKPGVTVAQARASWRRSRKRSPSDIRRSCARWTRSSRCRCGRSPTRSSAAAGGCCWC